MLWLHNMRILLWMPASLSAPHTSVQICGCEHVQMVMNMRMAYKKQSAQNSSARENIKKNCSNCFRCFIFSICNNDADADDDGQKQATSL